MTKNFELALEAATEYRTLTLRGMLPLADQAEKTIDDLVGSWIDDPAAPETHRLFVWPAPVATAAGVDPVRLRRRTSVTR